MDASRAQRRMEVAARIKELRATKDAQPEGSPAPAGDPAAPTIVPPAPAPAAEVTEHELAEENVSAASSIADLLRNGGGLFG